MMFQVLLLFVVLPAIELALLIEVGRRIGTGATLALIAVTGIVGAALARRQGLGVLRVLQTETMAGRLPAGSLADGVIILVAGALLVTPGILTDAFGFLCLVPAFRKVVKRALLRRLERAAQEARIEVRLCTDDPWGRREEKVVRDVGTDAGSGVPGKEAGSDRESSGG
jgi:UPF0716 protein FxsA